MPARPSFQAANLDSGLGYLPIRTSDVGPTGQSPWVETRTGAWWCGPGAGVGLWGTSGWITFSAEAFCYFHALKVYFHFLHSSNHKLQTFGSNKQKISLWPPQSKLEAHFLRRSWVAETVCQCLKFLVELSEGI